ncbi:MAG: LPS-assembly protein LptD [bacterium]
MYNRTRLYNAIRPFVNKKSLATATLTTLPLLTLAPTAMSQDMTQKWFCGVGTNGQWDCREQSVPGRTYKRPYHAAAERRPEDSGPNVRRAVNLDWVDEEFLTAEQRAALKSGCCGTYVEPERDYPDADLPPEEAPLRVAAASTEVLAEQVAKLEGGVQITQGFRQVRGDTAVLDQKARTARIEGNVQFREPGLLLQGDSAEVNLDTRDIDVENIKFVLHEASVRGTAGRLTRESEEVFVIENATYTTCDPTSNVWVLSADEVSLNTESGVGEARDVTLRLAGVPVFYTPWIRYPLSDKRTSGLLFPSVAISDDNGIDFSQPIYLNLAPNYDMTITPRYIQERGAALELEARHLSSYTETTIGGNFLSDDKGGDDKDDSLDPFGKRPSEGDDRWIAYVEHEGGFDQPWRSSIDYTEVSDGDYFRDIGTTTLQSNSTTNLLQRAELGYTLGDWDLSLLSHEYQNISNNPLMNDGYQLMPRLRAKSSHQFNDIQVTLDNQYSEFDHEEDVVTGSRINLDYRASWDKRWAWGYFKPGVGVHYISYDLDNTLGESSPNATIPVVSFDTGVFFERDTTAIGNFLQTFEPKIYGLFIDDQDQTDFPEFDTSELTFGYNQLFRDNRFTGGDRIGDTQQLSIGFTTRLISQDNGREVFRASIGQAYYLDDREASLVTTDPDSLTSSESPIAAEMVVHFSPNWRVQTDFVYDMDQSELDRSSVAFHYRGDNDALFNIGYRYTRRPDFVVGNEVVDRSIEQSDISGYVPLFGNWNFVARSNYDFTNSRELETFVGLEYNSCCWRISALARQWIDRDDTLLIPEDDLEQDSGIFLQIQFKGLGGTGTRVDSILSDSIRGYRAPD